MYEKKYLIQLTENSEWITERGASITHIMLSLNKDLDFKPYAYIDLGNANNNYEF